MTTRPGKRPGEGTGKLVKTLSGIALVAMSGLLGGLCGGLWIKYGMDRAANGWDGIADAIGGLMLGTFAGLVAGLLLLLVLVARSARAMVAATCTVALAAGLVFAYLWITRPVGVPDRGPGSPIRPPPAPIFDPRFEITVSHPYVDRLLRAMSPSEGPLPFSRAQVTSFPPDGPLFLLEELGADRRRCTAPLDFGALERMMTLAMPAIDENLGVCRRPGSELRVGFSWRFPDDDPPGRGASSLVDACLVDTPKLRELIAALDELGPRLGGALVCESIPAED